MVFSWLRRMGVRRILRVTVDDDQDPPHSDTIIEDALKSFDIEIWDWKRFDLCIDTILNASPGVREVSLYSTGNLAVLRDWSSEDGLGKLRDVSLASHPLVS